MSLKSHSLKALTLGLSIVFTLVLSSPVLAINVIISTSLGDIEIKLRDDVAPQTVANFLTYVNEGAYDNTFIHRSMPGFVIQGGGFKYVDDTVVAIDSNPPVINEPNLSNIRGTVAMAKFGGDPNSATNEWFINLADNSSNLDGQNGGFTVFGEVVGDGMQVADAIAAVQIWNAGGAFSELPLIDFPGGGAFITDEYLVLTSISVVNDFTINAGVNDVWVTDGVPFQGMFITVYPNLNLVFMAWFTFDSVAPAAELRNQLDDVGSGSGTKSASLSAVFGADDQRWVTALGSIDGNRTVLNAELTSGGLFNSSDPLPTQDTDYGTITLEFEDCKNAKVDFDLPKAGESGSFNIHRALDSNVALCEALNSE
jgi:peptidyl-prolyl cis-trans isomerase A (cyclophilin A)